MAWLEIRWLASFKTKYQHRTQDLRSYLLSDEVTEESKEFIPFQAAIDVLETTPATIKLRIEEGILEEKSFFLTNPVKKTYLGIEIGGVKKLLVRKNQMRERIKEIVSEVASKRSTTSYTDIMEQSGMNWRSPADKKFCNTILTKIGEQSYEETVDNGEPCLKQAVVISRNEHIPTNQFFETAAEMGLIDPHCSKEERHEFWREQLKRVHERYGK